MPAEFKDTVASPLKHGHKAVGTTAVQLVSTNPQTMQKGVLLRANSANAADVWVGVGSNVTADSAESTGGMPLPAGASMLVPTDDATKIWLISTAATQDIAWIGA